MTVLLPQRSHSSFYRSLLPSMHSMHCIIWSMGKYLSKLSFLINLTFLPLEMWYELFYHNFEKHSELLWMRKLWLLTSSTWLHHANKIRMGVHFPHYISKLNIVYYFQYFCKSRLHIILIFWFICNFLLFLNSLST